MNANKTFIGADGISLKYGYTVPSNPEAELVRLMIERTHGAVIVVADHSKWGVVSNFEVAKIDEVQTLVTDDQLSKIAHARTGGAQRQDYCRWCRAARQETSD